MSTPPQAAASSVAAEAPANWLFSADRVENTPSRAAGVTVDREARYRRSGADFIKRVGIAMKMTRKVYNSGIVMYHRFYMLHSFLAFPRYHMAAACLFVAGKGGEQPKKLRDMLKIVNQYLPRESIDAQQPEYNAQRFDYLKAKVLGNERLLLQALCFDLTIEDTPHHLFKCARQLAEKGLVKVNNKLVLADSKETINKLVQKASDLIEESYKTTLCVEFPPQIIAIALMNLAVKFSQQTGQKKYELVAADPGRGKNWWDSFVDSRADISQAVSDVCHRFLDRIDKVKKPSLLVMSGGLSVSAASSPASLDGSTPGRSTPRTPRDRDAPKAGDSAVRKMSKSGDNGVPSPSPKERRETQHRKSSSDAAKASARHHPYTK